MSLADKLHKSGNVAVDPKKERQQAKDNKASAEDLLRRSKLFSEPPVPNTPKKRGRSKSPGPEQQVEDIASKIRKRKMIQRLRALYKLFPTELAELANHDFHKYTTEQLQEIIESCEFALDDDIQIQFIPAQIFKAIGNVDTAAMSIAKLNPRLPFAKYAHLLFGLGNRAVADPSIVRDVKLIATRFIGLVPTNPYMRLLTSFAFLAFECIRDNRMAIHKADQQVKSEEYNDL